jgi:hypothetical protein
MSQSSNIHKSSPDIVGIHCGSLWRFNDGFELPNPSGLTVAIVTAYSGGFLNINTVFRAAKPEACSNIFLQNAKFRKNLLWDVIIGYCMLFSIRYRKLYSSLECLECFLWKSALFITLVYYSNKCGLLQTKLIGRRDRHNTLQIIIMYLAITNFLTGSQI